MTHNNLTITKARLNAWSKGSGDVSAATTGEGANAATTGDMANAATAGKGAVAASLGANSLAKASAGGAIVLVCRDNKGNILNIRASKVGENGIKPDVWYMLIASGEFVEVNL